MSMTEEKAALRRQIWDRLRRIPAEEMTAGDDALFARFLALPEVQQAKVIFGFWGIPGKEPETAKLIARLLEQGKVVGLPRMLPGRQMEVRQYLPGTQTVAGPFGIREPLVKARLSLCINQIISGCIFHHGIFSRKNLSFAVYRYPRENIICDRFQILREDCPHTILFDADQPIAI